MLFIRSVFYRYFFVVIWLWKAFIEKIQHFVIIVMIQQSACRNVQLSFLNSGIVLDCLFTILLIFFYLEVGLIKVDTGEPGSIVMIIIIMAGQIGTHQHKPDGFPSFIRLFYNDRWSC